MYNEKRSVSTMFSKQMGDYQVYPENCYWRIHCQVIIT